MINDHSAQAAGAGVMASVRNTVAHSVTKQRSSPRGQMSPRVSYDAGVAALLVLDLSGRIRYLNQAAREIFGVSLEQARGSAWANCVKVVDRVTRIPIQDQVRSIVNSDRFAKTDISAVLISPLGIDIPVEIHVEPFPELDDAVTGAVMTFYGGADSV